MAGELVDQIDPGKLFRESSMGYDLVGFSAQTPVLPTMANSVMRGVSLQKISPGSASGTPAVAYEWYNFLTTIPTNLTITTGLTFFFTVTDDGANAADLGLVIKIGIAVKKLTTGVNCDLSTGAGTEQTATVTLNATTGLTAQYTLAIANANLNGAGAGDQIGVRIRRMGADAADTCLGRVILIGGHIKNT